MWIKQQMLKWRIKRLTRGLPVALHVPDRVQAWELLELLDTEQFEKYIPMHGFNTGLRVLHPNADLFFANMQDIAWRLKSRRPINPELVTNNRVDTNLDKYLTTRDGYLMDIQAAVYTFKKHAQGICQAMDKDLDETHAHYEHNLRMLTHVFADIQVLTRALLSIAYRK